MSLLLLCVMRHHQLLIQSFLCLGKVCTIRVVFRASMDFNVLYCMHPSSGGAHAGEHVNSILDEFDIRTSWTKSNGISSSYFDYQILPFNIVLNYKSLQLHFLTSLSSLSQTLQTQKMVDKSTFSKKKRKASHEFCIYYDVFRGQITSGTSVVFMFKDKVTSLFETEHISI